MPLYNPTGSDDLPAMTATATDVLGVGPGGDTADAEPWLSRIESLIERHPWPTLVLALGIGYALSRKMR